MQLVGPDIDSNDQLGTMLQSEVRKSTRAGADIEHDFVSKLELECARYTSQLQPSSTNLSVTCRHGDDIARRNELTWLYDLRSVHLDVPEADI